MMSRCWVWVVVTTAADVKGLGATCRKQPLMQVLFFISFAKQFVGKKDTTKTTDVEFTCLMV